MRNNIYTFLKLALTLLLLFNTSVLCADTDTCNDMLNDAKSAYQSGKKVEAKQGFEWIAKNCDGNAKTEAQKYLNNINNNTNSNSNAPTTRLSVTPASANVEADAGTWNCKVSCTTAWTAASKSTWIEIVQNADRTSLTIKYESNPNTTDRSGSVIVKDTKGSVSKTISVVQRGRISKDINNVNQSDNFAIQSVEYCSVYKNGDTDIDYGYTTFKPKKIKYLKTRVKYNWSGTSKSNVLIGVKIYDPDGTRKNASNTYTFTQDITVYPGTNTVELLGWGNDNANGYQMSGTYRYEIWCNDKRSYSGSVYVNNTTTSSSYGSSSSSSSYSSYAYDHLQPFVVGWEFSYDHLSFPMKDYMGKYMFGMDGFHTGPSFFANFGSTGLGLHFGLHYQFAASKYPIGYDANDRAEWDSSAKQSTNELKKEGFTNINIGVPMYNHALLIPLKLTYTFDFGNDWSLMLISGFTFDFGLVLQEQYNFTAKYDGLKYGDEERFNWYNGKDKYIEWDAGEKYVSKGESDAIMKSFDLQLGFGLGFGYKQFYMMLNYDWGLVQRFQKEYYQSGLSIRESDLKIAIGFKFY